MTWLISGLCLLVAAALLGRWFLLAEPKTLAKVIRWVAIGGVLGLGLFIMLSGRFFILLPIALLALPFLRRRLTQGRFWPRSNPTPGQTSNVETDYVDMSLDHDSGKMTGRVKRGSFSGYQFEELSEADLIVLLGECQNTDLQAAQLVEAYLDRLHDGWREAAGADYGKKGAGGGGESPMTRDEAFGILGLDPGASDEDIRDAHHRLMLIIHPDQGGSTYLATKINQAKEVLLES